MIRFRRNRTTGERRPRLHRHSAVTNRLEKRPIPLEQRRIDEHLVDRKPEDLGHLDRVRHKHAVIHEPGRPPGQRRAPGRHAPPHAGARLDHRRELLGDLRITSHMFTSIETSRRDSRQFLTGFANGDYQALLAMKVLDEGVDIPAANQAFLLASSTVEREWIQRRGRILRNSPGKTVADLHDFVVIPPDPNDSSAASLLRSELRRAEHFARDSVNYYDADGPSDRIKVIEQQL